MSSLLNASLKGKSKSVLKLDEANNDSRTNLLSKRELSKSTPSIFQAESGQLTKRAMKILDSDEGSQSESGSVDQLQGANVDDKDVLEGLFKENKEILEFLSTALEKSEQKDNVESLSSEEILEEISEERDDSDGHAGQCTKIECEVK